MKQALLLIGGILFVAACGGAPGPGSMAGGFSNQLTRVGNPNEDIPEPSKGIRYYKTNPAASREDVPDVLLVTVDDARSVVAVQSLLMKRVEAPLARDEEGRLVAVVAGFTVSGGGEAVALSNGDTEITAYPSSNTDPAYDSFFETVLEDPVQTAVQAQDHAFFSADDLGVNVPRVRGFGMDEKIFIADFCQDPQTLVEIVRSTPERPLAARLFDCPCSGGRCSGDDIRDLGMASFSIESICEADVFRCLSINLLELGKSIEALQSQRMQERIALTVQHMKDAEVGLFPAVRPSRQLLLQPSLPAD